MRVCARDYAFSAVFFVERPYMTHTHPIRYAYIVKYMFYVIYCRWSRVRNRTDNRLNYFHVFRLFCLLLFPPFLISLFTRSIVFVLNCSLCFNVFIVLFVWIFCFSDFQNIYINLTPKKIANKTKKKRKTVDIALRTLFWL